MEVLMARAILPSRMLIALLGVTVIAGLAVVWIKSGKTKPADPAVTPVVLVKQPGSAKPEEPAAPPLLAAVAPAGPTTAPTTRPADRLPMMAAVGPAKPAATDPIAAAKAKVESGDLIAARKMLNDALLAGKFSPEQAATAKQDIATLNEKIIFSTTKFPADPFAESYTVKSGDRLAKIAARHDMTVEMLKRINGITDERKLQAGKSLKIINGPFSAVVSKSGFTIDLWLGPAEGSGSMYVKSYRVALGKDDGTPPGTWMVEAGKKQKNPKFWGAGGLPPMEADDPRNPLGEYWIGLVGTDGGAVGQTGYGIHGTIEPESIGKNASMGCVRLINEEVAVVFELLAEGKSTVVVKP
jgi:lipoprotein-anchoring transpeptidase ErfK/SrfK